MTPEKLGLYELKYLEILDKVLSSTLELQVLGEPLRQAIVLDYGKALKEDVLRQQTEGEVTDNASVE